LYAVTVSRVRDTSIGTLIFCGPAATRYDFTDSGPLAVSGWTARTARWLEFTPRIAVGSTRPG
jgi:hypothetical protein